MFSFQWPWLVLLLPLPLIVHFFWPRRYTATDNLPQLRLPSALRAQAAFMNQPADNGSRQYRWHRILLWSCWTLLVLTIMYPQILRRHVEVKQEGFDLMLAVDLSGSMDTPDFFTPQGQRINRLTAVKLVLSPFIEKRNEDRLGLILFADQAFLQAPLTLDNQAIRVLLEKTVIGMAGRDTAIGDAIGLAVKKLRDRPEESRILILLTDGDNNAGTLQPLKAAELAKQFAVRIYTIGVGSADVRGRGLNEKPLQEIAAMTGGQYYRANNLGALAQVYQHIDQTLQRTEAESRVYLQRTPLYHWPLGLALILLLVLYWRAGTESETQF